MTELKGSHVMLTGASRGLGPVIADALAQQGANLTLAARSEVGLGLTKQRVEPYGIRALAVPVDVTKAEDRRRLVDLARREQGAIDVLVNNAGLESTAWFTDLPPTEIEDEIAVNLTAPLLLTQLVLPEMLERRRGHIVNMASVAGKGGGPFWVTYSATKAGLVVASQALRAELAGTGVKVSTVCPGFAEREGMYARQVREVGMHASRWMGTTTPEKVATAVVRSIRRDAPELVVTPGPFRVLVALGELLPAITVPVTNWLVYRLGRAAADRRREEERGKGQPDIRPRVPRAG